MPGRPPRPPVTEFDPERFEDKYVHYLEELDAAYRAAFETMNEAYDSDAVHAIDQQVLNDSEPVYAGDGQFAVELPDDPVGRVEGVLVDRAKLEATLERYVKELEGELRRVFGLDGDDTS